MKTLLKIQTELKVPKGNFNSFGKYKYRSAEDILETVKPILKANNATLILSDEVVEVGSKIFLKATAYFIAGEETFNVSGYAETSEHKGMSSEQTTGTASSYARKYALNGLFLIDETEADADSQKPAETPVDDTRNLEKLKACNNLDELTKAYKSIANPSEAVNKMATQIKLKLTTKTN